MSFFQKIVDFINSTEIPAQIHEVDASGLFTNPWFLLPLVVVVGYMLYKQAFKDLILMALAIAAWVFSGSDYIKGATVDGDLQIERVLPIVFGAAVMLGIVIYMYFGRSD
jgi:hypothetical protein